MIELGAVAQIAAFAVCALLAVAGALGMATTMSMFRSGIFLISSFLGVSGLFILLSADLLALLQVMMYIGGMLVMILFMVLFAHDPGGAMMAGMEMAPVERLFSLGLAPRGRQGEGGEDGGENGGEGGGEGEGDGGGGGHHMDMEEMSMTTPAKRLAAWVGAAVGTLLVALLLSRPAWPVVEATPDPDSARRVGELLMGKYMMAFEGAGLLILVGIFGAAFLARPGCHPGDPSRGSFVGEDAPPPAAPEEPLPPRSGADAGATGEGGG